MHLSRYAFGLVLGGTLALGYAVEADEPTFAQRQLDSIHRYSMRTWDSNQGLPQAGILSMAQTADGFMWIGTEAELVRFDGTEFESYSRSTTPGFLGGYVNALLAEPDGTLWIGSSRGLTELKNGRFTPHSIRTFVTSLARAADGVLWIGTADGVVQKDGVRTKHFGTRDGLPAKRVLSVAVSRDGTVWAGTDAGLARLEGAVFRAVEALRGDSVRAILPASDGRLWIGTTSRGLFAIERAHVVSRWTIRDGLGSDAVYALREDREGAIWAGTNGGGMSRFRGGRFETLTHVDGLASDLVWTLHEDRDGAIWAGANGGGLVRLSRATFVTITSGGGISSDIVLPIYQAANGDLWIGTAGAGVNRLRRGRWIRHDIPGKVVLTIGGDRSGNIWVGSPQGLTRIRGGEQRHFTIEDGLPSKGVSAVHESSDGTLWIGTNGGGVARMQGEIIVPMLSTREVLSQDHVHCFLEHDGVMWVGTRGGGVNRIFPDGRIERLAIPKSWPSGIVYSLFRDREGAIWIGREGGLSRYKNGRISDFASKQGLPEDGVLAVLQDDRGGFWLSTNRGIFHAPAAAMNAFADGQIGSLQLDRFGTGDGMRSSECNGGVFPAALKGGDGSLWFPTIRGIVITDGQPQRSSIAPRPMIAAVMVDHELVAESRLRSPAALELHPGTHRLEIRYNAASFEAPARVTYQYRLDGADAKWIDAGSSETATYLHLPAGEYRFRVRARSRQGPWSDSEASLSFAIGQLWYRAWWFYVLVFILAGGAIASMVRARVRNLRLATELLQARVEERERAAAVLRESEAHFRSLIESAGDLMVIVSGSGIIEYVSPSVTRLLGLEADALARQPLEALVHPHDAAAQQSLLACDLSQIERRSADFRLRHRDGTWRAFHALAQRIDLRWLSSGILLTCRDVTERQLLQQQLEQAHRVASLGHLATTVAHEFNNVLMGIQPFAELLGAHPDDAIKTSEYALRIAESVRRGRRISETIIRYTRDLELQIVTFELAAWMAEVEGELRPLLPAAVALRIEPPSSPVWISGDPPLLMQVLINMALNARDAMPCGGTLEIRAEPSISTSNLSRTSSTSFVPMVKIIVSDNGKGIPADVLPHIFEPLFTTKRGSGCTGLGLSIAHHVVTKHAGAIYVDSLREGGTTFHIVLPQVAPPSVAAAAVQFAVGSLWSAEEC